jgi:glycosyltransferase involved in cell wall biosynthesis
MDMQKVSIIIPAYNQAHWLPESIQSALNQTVKCEVIVVNDGSPDNTSEVSKMFDVKLIEKENGGLSSARNVGIKESTGEWILTLDADDKIAPDFIEKCLFYKDEYDIIGTGQQEFGDSNEKHIFKTNPTFKDFVQNNQINCCSLFRKEIWETIGGYDEEMKLGYEDYDLWLRATKAGYKVITIPEYLFNYRKHGKSMVTNAIKNHDKIKQYILNKLA